MQKNALDELVFSHRDAAVTLLVEQDLLDCPIVTRLATFRAGIDQLLHDLGTSYLLSVQSFLFCLAFALEVVASGPCVVLREPPSRSSRSQVEVPYSHEFLVASREHFRVRRGTAAIKLVVCNVEGRGVDVEIDCAHDVAMRQCQETVAGRRVPYFPVSIEPDGGQRKISRLRAISGEQ